MAHNRAGLIIGIGGGGKGYGAKMANSLYFRLQGMAERLTAKLKRVTPPDLDVVSVKARSLRLTGIPVVVS
jgi:hypothetical protein